MRRLLLIVAGLAALTLSAPGAALANHGHRHHHKRGAHHAKFRFEHLGPTGMSTTGAGSGTGPSAGNPPAAAPATENAGKVASYTGGVLTLTLNDGSSVGGKVTNSTRIECLSASAPPPGMEQGNGNGNGNGNGPGDDNGAGDDNHQGDHHEGNQQSPETVAEQPQRSGDSQGEDDQGEEGGPTAGEPPCDTSALVAGAIVREAELRIGPSGTEFERIELVR